MYGVIPGKQHIASGQTQTNGFQGEESEGESENGWNTRRMWRGVEGSWETSGIGTFLKVVK